MFRSALVTACALATITAPVAGAQDLGSLTGSAQGAGSLTAGSLDALGSAGPATFDLQAHRGGLGLNTESSPYSFGAALEMGVSTLELDTQITRDGKVVVTHDRKTNPGVCTDTAPATPGDPQFPYVGKYVKDLTLAQIKTLDCGSVRKARFDRQTTHPGSQMMELKDVFALVKAHRAWGVKMNIETKVEAGAPEQTAPREQFVRLVHDEIAASGLSRQVTIQSFDWGALKAMHAIDPTLPLVALTNGDFLQVGQAGASPWLGGIDVDDFGGDGVKAAHSISGVTAYSPVATQPQDCSVADATCSPYVTKPMVDTAHSLGMKVIPWTVDDEATMNYLIDTGVDGIITDYPDVLRQVMTTRGMVLPQAYPKA